MQTSEALLTPRQMNELAEKTAVKVVEKMSNQPLLLDQCQLAGRLGVSVSSVKRLSESGAIPKTKLGRLVRYDLGEVLRALRE